MNTGNALKTPTAEIATGHTPTIINLDTPVDLGNTHSRPAPSVPRWRSYVNALIANELSTISRYCDRIVQWKRRPTDNGLLLSALDGKEKFEASRTEDMRHLCGNESERVFVLLNANINHDYDIEGTLARLHTALGRHDRLALVAYNPYFRFLYRMMNSLGIRKGPQPTTFVTTTDLSNIAKLAGYEIVRTRQAVFLPFRLFGIGNFVNRLFPAIPLLNYLSLVSLIILRPVKKSTSLPSLTIVIPARNEKGNIENALTRLPPFLGTSVEVIFVEGWSSDGTWDEIQKVVKSYRGPCRLSAFQQTGKGKVDAVRLGFEKASGDLLTILDADLTMPPELLERFYQAYIDGLADFINGSRLVYPMEGKAMRPLNHLGNVFFAKVLSFLLGVRLGDSLCGTKLVSREDYARFRAWREDFGDFDPFGDYELLFPASLLALGVIDIPIRYRDRTYGSTNINRFRHGLMLLKMCLIGFFRIRLGNISNR